MKGRILLRQVRVLPMVREGEVMEGNLLVEDGKIAYLGEQQPTADRVMDLGGAVLIPGLAQVHVHLCQTMLRGTAEDRSLLDWLTSKVWPLEAAMDDQDVYLSSLLGCAELLAGGTTTILDMATTHYTDAVFEAAHTSGIRATIGNSIMDSSEAQEVGLALSRGEAMREADRLFRRWHGEDDGRLRYCYAPRFPLGCSREMLADVVKHAAQRGVLIHTHLAENKNEEERVRKRIGMSSTEFLRRIGILGPRTVVAHCVHVGPEEWKLLAATRTRVAHCPSSNLKLGSGIAPVRDLMTHGIIVGLGSDGAPCNNRLDAFEEMRLCALLAALRGGPGSVRAWDVLRMATSGGTACLREDDSAGTLEVGKRADLVAVDLSGYHCIPAGSVDPTTTIVFSARASDVVLTVVGGEVVYTRDEGPVRIADEELRRVGVAAKSLMARVHRRCVRG